MTWCDELWLAGIYVHFADLACFSVHQVCCALYCSKLPPQNDELYLSMFWSIQMNYIAMDISIDLYDSVTSAWATLQTNRPESKCESSILKSDNGRNQICVNCFVILGLFYWNTEWDWCRIPLHGSRWSFSKELFVMLQVCDIHVCSRPGRLNRRPSCNCGRMVLAHWTRHIHVYLQFRMLLFCHTSATASWQWTDLSTRYRLGLPTISLCQA